MAGVRSLFFVVTTLVLVQSVLSQSDCRIPSEFWCDDPVVAQRCGVSEQCKAVKRAATDTPVEFTLYYESLCPGCRYMFQSQIGPAYSKLSAIMDLKLVPYGNAREHYDPSKKMWTFICQHGEQECVGNIIETCAINIYQNTSVFFPFVHCMEGSTSSPRQAATSCARQYKLDIQKILSCSTSAQGNAWEHQMGQKTEALKPQRTYVPWVTLNGVHTEQIERQAMTDLVGLICKTYKGTPKPPACT